MEYTLRAGSINTKKNREVISYSYNHLASEIGASTDLMPCAVLSRAQFATRLCDALDGNAQLVGTLLMETGTQTKKTRWIQPGG